ncbi:MAG: AAA family ATPase, partial [Polyangiaceae bacterium]
MSRTTSAVTMDDIQSLRPRRLPAQAEDAVPFPVTRIRDIKDLDETARWLVDGIWPTEGVGVLAGSPKTGKTWLAVELGIAVASGRPFLGQFGVRKAGSVLMFGAEDRAADLKARASGICKARNQDLDALAFDLIEVASLSIDHPTEFARLRATVRKVRPALVILDPFVRLFRGSENDAGAVSSVLGRLRALQRECAVAMLVVHHVRKRDAVEASAASIRGSGDFHAWADTSITLGRRRGGVIRANVEHRSSRSPEPLFFRLPPEGDAYLEVVNEQVDGGLDAEGNRADDKARALAFIRE